MNLDGTEVNLPEGEELAMQALQSADPAIGMSGPDLVAIREKVDTSDLVQVSSLSEHAARSTRFPRWSYAAAAAVLLVGIGSGAGYSIAALHSGTHQNLVSSSACKTGHPNCNDTGSTHGISMICTAESVAAGAGCNDTPRTLAGSISTTSGALGSTAAKSSSFGAYQGRPWLTPADSLSDTPGTGHAYIMSNKGIDRSAIVQNLIDAFDIGEHSIKHNSAMDDTDIKDSNTPASIGISSPDNSLSAWWYDNIDNGPDACNAELFKLDPRMHGAELKSGACAIKTGKVLSDSAAIDSAKDIFSKAGLDLDNVMWETNSGSPYFGQGANEAPMPYIQVVAHITVEGQDTTLEWNIEFAPDKSVIHASGIFVKPVQVPDYETVGAKTAVLRSQDLKWSEFEGPQLQMPSNGDVYFGGDMRGYGGGKFATDADGRPLLQMQLDQAEITSAQPSLGSFVIDGTWTMLPVYKLTDGERTWTQLAVADKYLQVK